MWCSGSGVSIPDLCLLTYFEIEASPAGDLCLVLAKPRKTENRPIMTEKMLTRT